MKNSKLLKISTSILGCFAIVSLGNYCYNAQVNYTTNNMDNVIVEENEPIIFTEVSSYDTLYDFSNSKILAEHSDLVVIGKITNIGTPTNFNPITKKYGKARTPVEIETVKVIKNDSAVSSNKIEFLDAGGLISYEDYEKSLLPAQKAKRDYLMQQNGLLTASTKSNIFVKQSVDKQLELKEDNTYIMYLEYNEDFGKYMVVSQPYGIKEYNINSGKILNHVTNTVETLEEMM